MGGCPAAQEKASSKKYYQYAMAIKLWQANPSLRLFWLRTSVRINA